MKSILILFAGLVLLSCKPTDSVLDEAKPYKNFRGFEPVDPTEYEEEVEIVIEENGKKKIVPKDIKLLSTEEILSFLNNETSIVSVGQIDIEGNITYLPVNISAKHTSYKITMDYMKSTTIGQQDENGFLGYKRIGVGLRLIAMITTTKADLNIGDISAIGIAVKNGQANGTLMAESIGIKSKEVTALFPWPSEINQTTVQNAAMALATIKSKIYDGETTLYPQVVAVKTVPPANNNSYKSIVPVIFDISKTKDSTRTNILTFPVSLPKATTTEESDKVKLQFGNKKMGPRTSLAYGYETDGFLALLQKDIDKSLAAFSNCYAVYEEFHNCDEIKKLLETNKVVLKDPNNSKWKEIYKTILVEYSYYLTPDLIQKLRKASL